MQIEKFGYKHLHSPGIVEALTFFQGDKVYVVCGVDGGGDAKDVMGDGLTPPQLGIILDIVNEERCIVEVSNDFFDGIQDCWRGVVFVQILDFEP